METKEPNVPEPTTPTPLTFRAWLKEKGLAANRENFAKWSAEIVEGANYEYLDRIFDESLTQEHHRAMMRGENPYITCDRASEIFDQADFELWSEEKDPKRAQLIAEDLVFENDLANLAKYFFGDITLNELSNARGQIEFAEEILMNAINDSFFQSLHLRPERPDVGEFGVISKLWPEMAKMAQILNRTSQLLQEIDGLAEDFEAIAAVHTKRESAK